MGGVTPNNAYPFPTYGDPANFPQQQQLFASAVDNDLQVLKQAIDLALDEPSARASRPAGTQVVATGTNVTVSYSTEDYDNNAIVNLGGSATDFVISTPGIYLLTGSVNVQPDGSATGAAALIMQSSAGTTPNPVGTSRQLDNDKDTSLSCTTLHRVPTAPETINMFVRHNHGANLNISIAQLTVTRIGSG